MNNLIATYILILLTVQLQAQYLTYTSPEKEDNKQMNYEILGKYNGSTIIYKNIKTENWLVLYDNAMKLKNKIKLTTLPTKLINVDFVTYPNFFYMIYQHQKKNIVYCEAIKFDADGKKMEENYILDTTSIPVYQNENKIYQVLVSDDKQKIAIIKANKKNERNHLFADIIYNAKLEKQYKRRYAIAMDGKNNFLDEFMIDNDGDIYVAKCYSVTGSEFVNRIDMLHMPYTSDSIYSYPVDNKDKILDEIMMKMDNVNKRVIIQTFFYNKRRGNIEGYYVTFFDKNNLKGNTPNLIKLEDSLRISAKDGVGSLKTAFNDFFIRQVYPRKDGGFIVAAESYYTTVRGNANAWNRFDFFNNSPNFLNSYDYYVMGGRDWYWDNFNRPMPQNTTYYAENVIVLSFNKAGTLEWSNAIHKAQKDDNVEDYISYQVMLTGGQLHFLYNDKDRNDFLLFDNSVHPAGAVTRHPTIKNLNRQYTIMPRHGKQITAKEMVFPCAYRNYICFAKIEY